MVAVQLTGPGGVQGVLLTISESPQGVQDALAALRGQRLMALVVSVIVAGLIGFLVASLITTQGQAPRRRRGGARRGPPRQAAEHERPGRDRRPRPHARLDANSPRRDVRRALVRARSPVCRLHVARRGGDRRRSRWRRPLRQPGCGGPGPSGRDGRRRAAALDPPRHPSRRRRERPRRDRPARLRDRRPLPAGRALGPARRPRPDRRASSRPGRARVRLQRRSRAAQSDRRHVGRDRGPALGRQGRSRGARALPRPPGYRRRPGQPA